LELAPQVIKDPENAQVSKSNKIDLDEEEQVPRDFRPADTWPALWQFMLTQESQPSTSHFGQEGEDDCDPRGIARSLLTPEMATAAGELADTSIDQAPKASTKQPFSSSALGRSDVAPEDSTKPANVKSQSPTNCQEQSPTVEAELEDILPSSRVDNAEPDSEGGDDPLPAMPSTMSNAAMTPQPVGVTGAKDVNATSQLLPILASELRTHHVNTTSSLQQTSADVEIKVLRMTLKPEALGHIEVTLRRAGSELRIQIAVEKEAAADALQRDLGLLRERLGDLVAGDNSHSITIVVQQPDLPISSSSPSTARTAGELGNAGQGSLHFGGKDKSAPHEQDARSPMSTDDHDEQDVQLQHGLTAIVV